MGSTPGKLVLVVGGARSGKSSFAQELASGYGKRVLFIATAEAGDAEMRQRILRHRLDRPADWETLELGGSLPVPELPAGVKIGLMDCFTVFLSNLMASRGLDWAPQDEDFLSGEEVLERVERVEKEALDAVEHLRRSIPTLVVVTNEVGMGLVPPFRLGRIFRDLAGRLNQKLALTADEVYAVMAGLPVRLKPEREGEFR